MSDEKQGAAGGGDAGGPAGGGKPMPPAQLGMKPIHLFNVAGIDVYLSWIWFVAFFYFVSDAKDAYHSQVWGGIECLGLFSIVLLHEFGHALACRQTGGKADRIVLWLLGGVAYVQPPPRPGAFLWSIAAGPLVNVVLIPITWGFYFWGIHQPWAGQAQDLLICAGNLAGLNLGLLIFNMMPVYPLDGGQILQSLLWFVIGRAYSLLVASATGFLVAAVAVVAALHYEVLPIPYTHWGIPRPFSFLLPFYIIWRSNIAFKQALAMVRVEKMPRVAGFACPSCGEKPFSEEIWLCDECKTKFNPFVTGKTCPHCGKVHEKVRCPFCKELSETERWRR